MIAAILLATALQAGPCADAMTQADMNACSNREYEIADGQLNAAWRYARDAARRRGDFDALLASQRAWIAFRDAQCKAVAGRYAGGSILPLIHNRCMTDLTETRTAQLRELAQSN